MHDEIYRFGTICFACDNMGLSSFASTASFRKTKWRKVVRYRRSRWFKVIEMRTNRKPICDFLLVFHRKCMPIFYLFRDITIYWSKVCFFAVFSHPTIVWSARSGVPLGLRTWKLVPKKLESLGYDPTVINFDATTSVWVTNRRTDKGTRRL